MFSDISQNEEMWRCEKCGSDFKIMRKINTHLSKKPKAVICAGLHKKCKNKHEKYLLINYDSNIMTNGKCFLKL